MNKLFSILSLLLISIFILSGCTQEQIQDYTQNKQLAIIFVQSSEEFKIHPGFDFLEKDPSVKICGINCFEFNFQYSSLGTIIGYKTDVIVKDGIPGFINKPTPLN
jgi:hypothetical protein